MPGERPGELQGCSYGCLWSWASGDPDLGSWVLTADNCVFLMPRDKSLQPRAVSWMLRARSLLREPAVGDHTLHSSPAASGSACPRPPTNWGLIPMPPVLSPGLPRGRRGAGGGPGAGGGAGLPGQPLQVHEGATHAHREGAPSRLQAECVPGVQAGRGSLAGDPIQVGCQGRHLHSGHPWVMPSHRRGTPLQAQGCSGWGRISVLGHWTASAQGLVHPSIAVALSGCVLVLCLPDRSTGMGCWLCPPPTEADRGPGLSFLQLTCGRSTKQWRSWGPMRW